MQVSCPTSNFTNKNDIIEFISLLTLFIVFLLYLDVEFGRLQARDMLQHLWTGPISNASVDVVQGSRSVEVRAVGVTKVSLIHVIKMFLFLNHVL